MNSPLIRPDGFDTLRFEGDALRLIDQTVLPEREEELVCRDVAAVHDAIYRLVVRGAPAIGIAAAYGVCLARDADGQPSRDAFLAAANLLATSRPTAVNLFWALDRMRSIIDRDDDGPRLLETLVDEASAIEAADRATGQRIGTLGAQRLGDVDSLLTHCNAGALATAQWGTALAPIYQLQSGGRPMHVFADETRPLLQGARLTAWELARRGVNVTVITDSMAATVMRAGKVQAVIVGADRITARGDVANKIGTYPLAVVARHHGVPFFVAAPASTFDLAMERGEQIPIETRPADEITRPTGQRSTVPPDVVVFNPAFDVTPADLVTAIITDHGVIEAPTRDRIASTLGSSKAVC